MRKLAYLSGICAFFLSASAAQAAVASYAKLVGEGRYWEALSVTCRQYHLNCSQARFSIVRAKGNGNVYAETELSKHIILQTSAFHHNNEPQPHQGWLAAVVGHELVHIRQSRFGRVYSRLEEMYFSNSYYVAAQELEGWGYMLENAQRFHLTCAMTFEIEFSREYYEWIVNHQGKLPPSGGVPTKQEKFRRLREACLAWNR